MSSDVRSVLECLRMSNYTCVIVVTAVVYDYLLTFSREVEYVWLKRWTWVSVIFVLTRYAGLLWAILISLGGSSFIPLTLEESRSDGYSVNNDFYRCTTLRVIVGWEFPILLNAADLVMIMRIYAMWNRSKRILFFLLLIYVLQVIVSFIFIGIYYDLGTHLSVTIVEVTDLSFCEYSWRGMPPVVNIYDELPRFVLGVALLVLAIFETTRQSIEAYRMARHWQPGRYMGQLMREGVLYFLANSLFNILYALQPGFTIPIQNPMTLLMNIYCHISLFPMVPRFITSVRELYDRDLKGIDTGFGVLSLSDDDEGTIPSIAFADSAQAGHDSFVKEDATGGMLDAIQLEALEDNTSRV